MIKKLTSAAVLGAGLYMGLYATAYLVLIITLFLLGAF